MSQSLYRCCCNNVNVLVYVLVILFGVASWVDINGLWVELPILVQHLPEGWDLPSYMAVIIQVANVAPLLYTITSAIWPQRRIEVPVIYVIISVGVISCLLLAFFWDKTSSIAGTEHSTALLVLQFFLALVDCTSSVAFLPFMSIFKPQYMIAYFIGEGFSGLMPSLISLSQGAGSMKCVKATSGRNGTVVMNFTTGSAQFGTNGTTLTGAGQVVLNMSSSNGTILNSAVSAVIESYPIYNSPRFTVQTFFLLLMCLMILSLLSFTLLNYWSYCQKEYVKTARGGVDTSSWPNGDFEDTTNASTPMTRYNDSSNDIDDFSNVVILNPLDGLSGEPRAKIYNPKRSKTNCCHNKYKPREPVLRNSSNISVFGSSSTSSDTDDPKGELKKMSRAKYALFLLLTAWINALMCGVLPSIQTYSCLPYGIQPYHLSVTLASISNPVACFAALFLKMSSAKITLLLTFLGSALSGYVLWTAAASPSPPLVGHPGGAILVILSWIVVVFFLTYTKVSIAVDLRKEGRRAMLWVGAFTQVGALVGAVVIFFIINYYKLFEWANPCV